MVGLENSALKTLKSNVDFCKIKIGSAKWVMLIKLIIYLLYYC